MKHVLLLLDLLLSHVAALFAAGGKLHTARFARLHELSDLLTAHLPTDSLILGLGSLSHILHVRSTRKRRELGNLLVVAPTRGGKGLLAVSQLLTWRHSAIVNDIKGELFDQTAGFRRTLGRVYVFDPGGVGHRFDPFLTKTTEKDLLSAATHLLHQTDEGEGRIFTQRATNMLTQLFLAARAENKPLLPYTRQMVRVGLTGCVRRLMRVSPILATQFLDCEIEEASLDDRFLISSWGTLSARMRLLLTDSVVRSFSGSDFQAREIIQGNAPVTVYLRWPEQDFLMLSPLMRLLWSSLINGLIATFDSAKGNDCRPVLLLIDEAGVSPIPNLHRFASTVCGRNITLWLAVQALSQLEALYGKNNAETIINNCDTQIYYRQASLRTAEYIERSLGKQSGFAHSQNLHEGEEASRGLSEQAISLLTAQQVKQLGYEEILGFFSNRPPFKAKRMDWRHFPVLRQRRAIAPPALSQLPALAEDPIERGGERQEPDVSWKLSPDLTRRRTPATYPNGFKRNRSI